MSNLKCPHGPTPTVIDGQRHKSILRQLIRYPRLQLKRVRVVRQQLRLIRRQRRKQLLKKAISLL